MLEIIKKLSEALPKESIQRTKGTETKKGYDTTGFGYQYAVNRLNEICGDKWGFTWEILKEREGSYKSGMPFFEITVRVTIWVGANTNGRSCVGGHISSTYFDALKGAITNAFKKTASFWGVGRQAYEGSIDDDNTPYPDSNQNVDQTIKPKVQSKPKGNFDIVMKIIERASIDEIPKIKEMLNEKTWTELEKTNLRNILNVKEKLS